LANRFCHLDSAADAEAFAHGITPAGRCRWWLNYRRIGRRVLRPTAAFIGVRPGLLSQVPGDAASTPASQTRALIKHIRDGQQFPNLPPQQRE
jgi:hypothetical protein